MASCLHSPALRWSAEIWGLCQQRCSGTAALSCWTPGSGVCRKGREKETLQVRKNNVLLPQSVLGALIAVNLKNSLKQLADPYYLWKKSKLDCVGIEWPLGTPSCPCPVLQPHSPVSSSVGDASALWLPN